MLIGFAIVKYSPGGSEGCGCPDMGGLAYSSSSFAPRFVIGAVYKGSSEIVGGRLTDADFEDLHH